MNLSSEKTKLLERAIVVILACLILFGAFYTSYAEGENPDAASQVGENEDSGENEPEEETGDIKISFPERIWQGSEFEITLSANLPLSYAVFGSISFESDALNFIECRGAVPEWTLTHTEDGSTITYLCVDTLLSHKADGMTDILVIKFAARSDIPADSLITFNVSNLTASDGAGETVIEGGEFSKNLSPALSHPAGLQSLFVRGKRGEESVDYNVVPEFDPAVTDYTVYVDDIGDEFEMVYTCDEYSSAIENRIYTDGKLSSCELNVTSEDGFEGRKYIISFSEIQPPAKDENESNAKIKEISLSNGLLSPKFSASAFEYTVYITSSIDSVIISALTESPDAVASNLTLDIKSGERQVLTCTAKDGTALEYYFTVKVISERAYAELAGDNVTDTPNLSLSLPIILIILFAVAFTGFFVGFIIAAAVKKNSGKRTGKSSRDLKLYGKNSLYKTDAAPLDLEKKEEAPVDKSADKDKPEEQ